MNSSRRLQYLSAMGIDCWLPYQQLPGAAPGRVWRRQVINKHREPPPAQPLPGLADSAASLMLATAERRHNPKSAKLPATAATPLPASPAEAASADAFRLGFYTSTSSLLVVDQVVEAAPQRQLIGNLLFALGHTELAHNQPDYFDWPVANDRRGLDLSPHEMVYGALQRLLEQHNPRQILLLGALAAQHVLGIASADFIPGMALESSPLYAGVSLIGTHSSAAMLENPLLKAETWQHLQSLRG